MGRERERALSNLYEMEIVLVKQPERFPDLSMLTLRGGRTRLVRRRRGNDGFLASLDGVGVGVGC